MSESDPTAGDQFDAVVMTSGNRPPSSARFKHLCITVVCLVLMLMVVGGSSILGWVGKHQTGQQLASTRAQLGETSAELASTKGALISAQGDLGSIETELRRTEKHLDKARAELSRTEGSLTQAHDRMDLQANHIETLKTCLGGVTRALQFAAYADYLNAVTELRDVETSCDKANSLM